METKMKIQKELEKNQAKLNKVNEKTMAAFDKIAKKSLGERWECRYVSRRCSYCYLTFSFKDKNGYSTDLELLYDAVNAVYENDEWLKQGPSVKMNVAAMGSFSIDCADDRATYYTAVGTIMTNKKLQEKLKKIFTKYYEELKELNLLEKKYKNIIDNLD